MKFPAALLVLALASPVLAQTRQPAQITTLPTTSPQEFDLLDGSGAWSRLGYVDPSSHAFQAVAGGVALSSFGAVPSPTGTPADASAALTAAVNYVNGRPIPIIVDGRYGLNSWSSNKPFDIEGTNNSQSVLDSRSFPCPSGFVNLGGPTATMITGTGLTARVAGLCIEMAAAQGTQTAGAAILFRATATNGMGYATAENNTIFYPFNGVETEADTAGNYQNEVPVIRDNSIAQPTGAGIAVGLTSVGAHGGNGALISGNVINCNGNYGDGGVNGPSTSVGLWFASAAPIVSDNSPYRCAVGTKLVSTLDNQVITGSFSGWMGDTATLHELEIGVPATSPNSLITKVNFTGWYVGQTGYATTDQPITIYNKGATKVNVRALTFVGGMLHDGGPNPPVNDFWVISDNVQEVTITGNQFYNDGGASVPALHFTGNTLLSTINVTGNSFVGQTWKNAVSITGSGDGYTIAGNDFTNTTTPVSWPTLNSASSRAVIRANFGGDNLVEYNGPVLSVVPGDGNTTAALVYGDNTTGLINLTAGATPGGSGNVKLSFNRVAKNAWTCAATLGLAGTGAWSNNAMVFMDPGAVGPAIFWRNNGVNLTPGQVYQIFYNGCASQ
jgi:hypothetical protein